MIESFIRNVKAEMGNYLYTREPDTLNQAFSKARAYDGELQLRRLRSQRNMSFKKPLPQRPFQRTQPKECSYCKKQGHEEKECITKAFHQQRNWQNFRERRDFNRPPDTASPRSHATGQETEYPNEDFNKDQEARTSEHPELD